MPNRESWRQSDFLRYLEDNPVAEKAINNLVSDGCSRGRFGSRRSRKGTRPLSHQKFVVGTAFESRCE